MNKITLLVMTALALLGVSVGQASAQAVPLNRFEATRNGKQEIQLSPKNELGNPWVKKGSLGLVYAQKYADVVPLYYYYNSGMGDHFYTTDYNELRGGAAGWNQQPTTAWVYATQVSGTIPVYRFADAAAKHYYTTNRSDFDGKYTFERIAAYIYPSWAQPTVPSNPGGPTIIDVTPSTPSNPPSVPPRNPGGPTIVPGNGGPVITDPNRGGGPIIIQR